MVSDRENASMRGVVPLLQVGTMQESLTYYEKVLGFNVDFVWPSEGSIKWAGVSRDDVMFMLTIDLGTSNTRFIAEKGNGVVFYIIVEDVEGLYQEMRDHGALIAQDLHTFGERQQFSVADLNGYIIAFSQAFR